MNATLCPQLPGGLCPQSTRFPWYYSPKPSLIDGLPDPYLAVASPLIAYWTLSLFFHYLDSRDWKYLQQHRIHDSAEVASRNRASRSTVILAVIVQQALQTALGLFWVGDESAVVVNHDEKLAGISEWLSMFLGQQATSLDSLSYFVYWWGIPMFQFILAIFVMDTWQYFIHRGMHMNKFLYRHIHSVHHQLYVPYAFGALYNHPVEGFFLDSIGAVISETVSGMSTRQAALLFCIATFKTVDDHCGYKLPFDPLQFLTSNNADYHDIHHQMIGIKYNFAQPFFVHWDYILGTQMTRQEMEQRKVAQKKRDKAE